MNETDIRKYANLMQELGLTGLEITDDKKVVRLERNVTEQIQQIVPVGAGNSGVSQTAGENAQLLKSILQRLLILRRSLS